MAIIILEGCDCTGKSTLAEELSRVTGFEIVKGSSFEIAEKGTNSMFDHMSSLLDRNNIIIDRFYLSNYVYGNLYEYPTMSDIQFAILADKAEKNALTIYVSASIYRVKDRMAKRGDDTIKVDEVEKIMNKYQESLNKTLLSQKLTLNVNTDYYKNTALTATMISEFLKLQETTMFIKDAE